MQSFDSSVSDFFRALRDEAKLKLYVSPLVLPIDGARGPFEGHYAFFGNGAVRAEVQSGEITGVSLWTSPGNLNKPDFFIDLSKVDAFAELDTIAKAMRGEANTLTRDQGAGFFESSLPEGSSETDVGVFMASVGSFAWEKKLSTLFDSYEVWAQVNNKTVLSKAYFINLAKNWLIRNGEGTYSDLEIKKAEGEEKTQVNSAQDDMFDDQVYNNEVYHKAILLETALHRLAQDDSLINGLYLCGGPGDDRRILVRDLFQGDNVWDEKVIWKSNSIHGIGSLMELLWKYRKGKILVLEGVDGLLKRNRGQSRDLLLKALRTETPTRMISYTRAKRGNDEKQE